MYLLVPAGPIDSPQIWVYRMIPKTAFHKRPQTHSIKVHWRGIIYIHVYIHTISVQNGDHRNIGIQDNRFWVPEGCLKMGESSIKSGPTCSYSKNTAQHEHLRNR